MRISGKIILVLLVLTYFPSLVFSDDNYNIRSRYSFLAENKWKGEKIYHHKDNIFEIKPFIQKEGSRLFKIRREGINYYLEEVHDEKFYTPYAKNQNGFKILELSTEIYKWEHLIKFKDGEELLTTPTMYRVFNGNYKRDTDPLYGDWVFEQNSKEYHEYKTVRGSYQFLIHIPDYDEASRYNEEGWHYLRYVKENEFETDPSFPDARFKLMVKSNKELVLVPQFLKHDKTDGIVFLHPAPKEPPAP
ncbi:MAG: hypothetical protein RBT69_03080 [Spirochaetia bacterium]|nr:hypothetical protein [Spirochaetia bacterium]